MTDGGFGWSLALKLRGFKSQLLEWWNNVNSVIVGVYFSLQYSSNSFKFCMFYFFPNIICKLNTFHVYQKKVSFIIQTFQRSLPRLISILIVFCICWQFDLWCCFLFLFLFYSLHFYCHFHELEVEEWLKIKVHLLDYFW